MTRPPSTGYPEAQMGAGVDVATPSSDGPWVSTTTDATPGALPIPIAAPGVARKIRAGDFVGYLYRCYSADGDLVYIGSTSGMGQRVSVHRRQSWFFDRIALVRYWRFPNIGEAREAEAAAIAAERPLLNQQGNPLYAGMTDERRRVALERVRDHIAASPVEPDVEDGEPEVTAARMRDAMARVSLWHLDLAARLSEPAA